jgi:hypothetical protein
MRKYGRAAFMGVMLSGLFVWAACGDDDDAIVAAPPEANDAAVDHRLLDATVVIDDDAPDPDAAKPPKVHGPYDAGPENAQLFDGGDVDGGIPCVAGGELEIEGNDTHETANAMNPPQSRCGVARVFADADAGDAGDAAPAVTPEPDVMTFTISPSATDIYVQYHGDGVQVLVQAGDGGVQDITLPNVTLPFKRDTPYYVEVRSKTGKDELWRVSVFEDH